MSAVTGSSFSCRQNVSPSMPGMPMSSTTTSGARPAILSCASSAELGLVDLDVHHLERRAQQDAQRRVVVDDEQPQPSLVELRRRATAGSRSTATASASSLNTWTRSFPANFAA